MCGWVYDLVICKFRKSMVVHDTECPYWDQVSLNNTKQTNPFIHIKSILMFEMYWLHLSIREASLQTSSLQLWTAMIWHSLNRTVSLLTVTKSVSCLLLNYSILTTLMTSIVQEHLAWDHTPPFQLLHKPKCCITMKTMNWTVTTTNTDVQ